MSHDRGTITTMVIILPLAKKNQPKDRDYARKKMFLNLTIASERYSIRERGCDILKELYKVKSVTEV